MGRIQQKLAAKEKKQPQNKSNRDLIETQLNKYLSEPLEDLETTDPVEYWFGKGKRDFPLLFPLAIDYLPIPASSVASK